MVAGGVGATWASLAVVKEYKLQAGREHYLYRCEVAEAERAQRAAEEKANGLEKQIDAQRSAIETSSLPWFPKNDRLEARFEADAMDKMENPVVSWDSIPGLGGTS